MSFHGSSSPFSKKFGDFFSFYIPAFTLSNLLILLLVLLKIACLDL
uniref:Uncharacterized protein n=1 Tax=Arundo donax TaxID=35708 RepID=A0A0A9AAN7_ARUDO